MSLGKVTAAQPDATRKLLGVNGIPTNAKQEGTSRREDSSCFTDPTNHLRVWFPYVEAPRDCAAYPNRGSGESAGL